MGGLEQASRPADDGASGVRWLTRPNLVPRTRNRQAFERASIALIGSVYPLFLADPGLAALSRIRVRRVETAVSGSYRRPAGGFLASEWTPVPLAFFLSLPFVQRS